MALQAVSYRLSKFVVVASVLPQYKAPSHFTLLWRCMGHVRLLGKTQWKTRHLVLWQHAGHHHKLAAAVQEY
jgi:hypothetical protein